MWGGAARNRLTILEPSTVAPGLLKTVSYLPKHGGRKRWASPTRCSTARASWATGCMPSPSRRSIRCTSSISRTAPTPHLGRVGGSGLLGLPASVAERAVAGIRQGRAPGRRVRRRAVRLVPRAAAHAVRCRNADQPRELQRVLMGKRGSDSALLRITMRSARSCNPTDRDRSPFRHVSTMAPRNALAATPTSTRGTRAD